MLKLHGLKITHAVAHGEYWRQDRLLDKAVERINKISDERIAIEAAMNAGTGKQVVLLKKWAGVNKRYVRMAEVLALRQEITAYARELAKLAAEPEPACEGE